MEPSVVLGGRESARGGESLGDAGLQVMENPRGVASLEVVWGVKGILRLGEPRGEDDCGIDGALRGDRDPAGI